MKPAPSRMSSPAWGIYQGAIDDGPDTPRIAFASMRRKRWLYVGVFDPRFVLGVAIVDVGFASNAFAYLGMIEGKSLKSWKSTRSPWAASVNRKRARWNAGREEIEITLPSATESGMLRGVLRGGADTASFELKLAASSNKVTATTCVAPVHNGAHGRWNLTIKDNTLCASGSVRWGDTDLNVSAPAIVDVTDAYPPRRTVWHWASLAGTDRDGRSVGINLCALHNDSDLARENVVWIDGEPHPLGAVRFDFERNDLLGKPWTITGDGVDLRFEASGMRVGDENLGLVVSRFVQPYGRFHGFVTVDGRTVELASAYGVVEDHEAVW